MERVNLSKYNHENWKVVRLIDYFERLDISTPDTRDDIIRMVHWCQNNLDDSAWEQNGVTMYSYRFQFRNSQDALAFKLRFGV